MLGLCLCILSVLFSFFVTFTFMSFTQQFGIVLAPWFPRMGNEVLTRLYC